MGENLHKKLDRLARGGVQRGSNTPLWRRVGFKPHPTGIFLTDGPWLNTLA